MSDVDNKMLASALARAGQALIQAAAIINPPATTTTTTTTPNPTPTTATTTPNPTTTTTAAPSKMDLGINMAGGVDWSTEILYKNTLKQSREWTSNIEGGPYNGGPALDLDADDNVKSLVSDQHFAESMMFVDIDGHAPDGQYLLSADGAGVIQFNGMATGTYTFPSSSPFIINVNAKNASFLALRIRKTDPTNYLKNISLVQTGVKGESIFHQSLSNRYYLPAGPFKVMRMMDWLNVNSSGISKWADRAQLSHRSWALGKGMPIEIACQFANESGVIPWFNIPHLADDDYVANMAKLIDNTLNPDKTFYLEFSNECWNTIMAQQKWCQSQGVANNLASDPYEAGCRFYAARAAQCFRIFDKNVNSSRHYTSLLNAHHKDIRTGQWMMKTVSNAVDAIAIAPYWGHGDQLGDLTKMAVDDVLNKCASLIEGNIPFTKAYADLAKSTGAKLIAYEAGQHMTIPGAFSQNTFDLLAAVNRDARIKDLYLRDMQNWQDNGGSTYCLFSSMGRYTASGFWGLLEYYDQTSSPKWQAAVEFSVKSSRK